MLGDRLSGEEQSRRWREVLTLYLIMTLGTLLVDQIAQVWSPFAGLSVLIVALGFIFLPTEYLLARGESPKLFGIGSQIPLNSETLIVTGADNGSKNEDLAHIDQTKDLFKTNPETTLQRSWRCTKEALWISLLVFPLFMGGSHLWRTWQGQDAHLSSRALLRWNEEFRGFSYQPLSQGTIHIGTSADRMRLRWKLKPGEKEFRAHIRFGEIKERDLRTQLSKVLSKSSGIRLIRPNKRQHRLEKADFRDGVTWTIIGKTSGFILFSTEREQVSVRAFIDKKEVSSDRYRLGEFSAMINEHPTITRDYSWLWSVFFIQLFLVGLPEEIFYRGYLQTRLDSLIGKDQLTFGVYFNWSSTVLCSLLFAIAHLVTIPHPSRLAVFFPSLLFGWMRRAYRDTLSPAIFHALCNVLSQILWGIYALG